MSGRFWGSSTFVSGWNGRRIDPALLRYKRCLWPTLSQTNCSPGVGLRIMTGAIHVVYSRQSWKVEIIPGIVLQLSENVLLFCSRLQCSYIVCRKGPLNIGSSTLRTRTSRRTRSKERCNILYVFFWRTWRSFTFSQRVEKRPSFWWSLLFRTYLHILYVAKYFIYVHNYIYTFN